MKTKNIPTPPKKRKNGNFKVKEEGKEVVVTPANLLSFQGDHLQYPPVILKSGNIDEA